MTHGINIAYTYGVDSRRRPVYTGDRPREPQPRNSHNVYSAKALLPLKKNVPARTDDHHMAGLQLEERRQMATRLSININDDTAKALRDVAEREDTSVTEIVRRAVSVYKFFYDEDQAGKEIQLVDARNEKVTAVQMV